MKSLSDPWASKDAWVFDLDNTLYPAECDLFAQIDVKMTDFVARHLGLPREQARALQKQYLVEHGTTLNGMMREHDLPPAAFLDYVHDIDLSPLSPAPLLAEHLSALPGKRLVFTNGSRRHGERVLDKLGLTHLFDDVFDIKASAYTPKPHLASYHALMARHGFAGDRAVFFEDLARNLAPAAELGFTTVLVRWAKDWSHEPAEIRPAGPGDAPAHVHHTTDDLTQFLGGLFVR